MIKFVITVSNTGDASTLAFILGENGYNALIEHREDSDLIDVTYWKEEWMDKA